MGYKLNLVLRVLLLLFMCVGVCAFTLCGTMLCCLCYVRALCIIIVYSYPKPTLMCVIIVAVTEGLVREEQLLHDMCLLSATTVEITQILTRAGPLGLKYI